MVNGHIKVGDSLCLNALRCIHHEQGSFAGCDGAGDFVGKVHVARSVDEVEIVSLSLVLILHPDGVALYRDALFLFQVHIVKYLVFHFPCPQSACKLYKSVCEGAFAVVNVGYDTEIAYILHSYGLCLKCKYNLFSLSL